MRIIGIFFFSFFLHFMVLSFDSSLFLPKGKNWQAQKISYAVRSIDSFRPLDKPVVAIPTRQVLNAVDTDMSVEKKTGKKAILKDQHSKDKKRVVSDRPIKSVVQRPVIADDLTVDDLPSENSDDTVDVEEIERSPEPALELSASEGNRILEPVELLADNPVDSSVRGDNQNNEESLISSDNYQSALPRYDINPRPEYPRIAKTRGWEGVVLFDVLVRKDGRVGRMKILSSSGYRSLDNAAKKVLRRWKFVPGTTMGIPVESQVKVPIRFSLQTL